MTSSAVVPGANTGLSPSPGAPILGNVNYMPPGFEEFFKQPFSYQIVYPSINNTTQPGYTNINNDSYFVCTTQTATIWDAATQATTNVQPNVFPATVILSDTSSGKNQMSSAVPFANYFGTALNPFVWLYRAQIYLPGGQITCQLQTFAAVAYYVTLTFTGFKVYPKMLDQLGGPE